MQCLTEQSQAASEALAELSDAENDVLHKYLLLFDELASEYLLEAKLRGWPTDHFAQASAGIGALATGTKSHLESISNISYSSGLDLWNYLDGKLNQNVTIELIYAG